MFRSAIPTFRAAQTQASQARTYMSKASFIGRLGAAPEKASANGGSTYYRYKLVVNKPPKRDSEGKMILDESGYPARDSNWFTIFSFRDNADAIFGNLLPGSLLYVEATIDTFTAPPSSEGGTPIRNTVFKESSHKVLSRPKPSE